MDPTVISVLNLSVYAIYFMLPAYLSNVTALAFGGGKPLDFKRNFIDGRRLFGDGVTWRGTIIGTLIGTAIGLLQGIITGNPTQGAILGLCLGGGALVGDACGSFIKRRLKVERGRPAPLLDQLDFVIGALIFASLVVSIPFNLIILIIIITIFLHLGANIIAYLLGMKDVWY
ncbi:MAG TPA: CDP-2,3-bis-(O-geranylgeranyl)-sn-glycerol synthase [Methanobacteriaceae archaeon]|nr:CDP-2,3-bis-(O-geranylgeranyl)-sn-glycerol synthase [Methanobacteriaceae archaeon]